MDTEKHEYRFKLKNPMEPIDILNAPSPCQAPEMYIMECTVCGTIVDLKERKDD